MTTNHSTDRVLPVAPVLVPVTAEQRSPNTWALTDGDVTVLVRRRTATEWAVLLPQTDRFRRVEVLKLWGRELVLRVWRADTSD